MLRLVALPKGRIEMWLAVTRTSIRAGVPPSPEAVEERSGASGYPGSPSAATAFTYIES